MSKHASYTALAAVPAMLLLNATASGAQELLSVSSSRGHAGEERLRVDVRYGAGRLEILPADAGTLYRLRMDYDEAFEPVTRYADGRLTVGIESRGRIRGRVAADSRLRLAVGPDAELDLRVEFGAGVAELDLGGLRLQRAELSTGASESALRFSAPNPGRADRLEINTGAGRFEAVGLGNANAQRIEVKGGIGEVILDFTGEWRQDGRADVSIGLGALTLRVPRNLGIRIERQSMLSAFSADGFVRNGNTFVSENWDDAERRLTIHLSSALGTVNVIWVEPARGTATQ